MLHMFVEIPLVGFLPNKFHSFDCFHYDEKDSGPAEDSSTVAVLYKSGPGW